jgi:hypothetical protein
MRTIAFGESRACRSWRSIWREVRGRCRLTAFRSAEAVTTEVDPSWAALTVLLSKLQCRQRVEGRTLLPGGRAISTESVDTSRLRSFQPNKPRLLATESLTENADGTSTPGRRPWPTNFAWHGQFAPGTITKIGLRAPTARLRW